MDPYSLSVIASDPKSGVRSLRKTVTLILPNNSIEEEGEDEPSLKESLLNLLHENLNKFWPDIGGILLGFGHIKFSQLKLEWMRDKVAVKLKGKFYVFHPVVGAEMQCTVASRDNERVTCKILNQFIIDVYSPDSCWNHVVKNEVVSVKIELVSQLPGEDVPKMFGKILFNSSSKEYIENVENIDLLTEDEDLEDSEAVTAEVCQSSTTQSSTINVTSTSVSSKKRKLSESSATEKPPKDKKKKGSSSLTSSIDSNSQKPDDVPTKLSSPKEAKSPEKKPIEKIIAKPLDFNSSRSGDEESATEKDQKNESSKKENDTPKKKVKANEAPEGFKMFPRTKKTKLKLTAPNGKSFQTYKAAWEWVEKNPTYLQDEREPQTPKKDVNNSKKHVKDDELQSPEKKGNESSSPLKKVAEPKTPQKTVNDTVISKKVEKETTMKASNQETKDQKLPDSDVDMFDCHTQQSTQKDAEKPKDQTSSSSKREDLDSGTDSSFEENPLVINTNQSASRKVADSESESESDSSDSEVESSKTQSKTKPQKAFESSDSSESDSSNDEDETEKKPKMIPSRPSETVKKTNKESDEDSSSDSEEEATAKKKPIATKTNNDKEVGVVDTDSEDASYDKEERNSKKSKTKTTKTPKKNAEPLSNKQSPIVNWINKNKKKDTVTAENEKKKATNLIDKVLNKKSPQLSSTVVPGNSKERQDVPDGISPILKTKHRSASVSEARAQYFDKVMKDSNLSQEAGGGGGGDASHSQPSTSSKSDVTPAGKKSEKEKNDRKKKKAKNTAGFM